MTPTQIVQQRLANQSLTQTLHETAAQVVARFGAVQAQDYSGAKWALGQRMVHATDALLDDAFNAGEILRTHILRPTWHFVAPEDIRWMLHLSAPRVHAAVAFMYRTHEFDPALLKKSIDVFVKTLRDGKQCTREELGAALKRAGIVAEGNRLAHLVMYAELEGILVSGARRGKQFTYALLQERAPNAKPLARDEALHELTRRYFLTRGPATMQDFAWWSGLTMSDAKKGIALCGTELASEAIAAQSYWFAPHNALPKTKSPTAHLLPNYDEYMVAYRERSALVDTPITVQFDSRGNSLLNNTIFIDGKLVGAWKRTLQKSSVVLETIWLRPLTRAEQNAFTRVAKQYATFLGLSLELQDKNAK